MTPREIVTRARELFEGDVEKMELRVKWEQLRASAFGKRIRNAYIKAAVAGDRP